MRLEIEPAAYTPADTLISDTAPAAYSPDVRALVSDGVAAAQAGDRNRARVLLTQATDRDPANSEAWMWLASISEYPEELLVFLTKVLECDPSNQRAIDWYASTRSLIAKNFVHRGVTAKDEGNLALALDCFDKAIENDARSDMAWFWKASISEDEAVVVECLNKVLEIDPSNEDARAALASIDDARIEKRYKAVQKVVVDGDWRQALSEIDDFLADNLASVEAWTLRSHISESVEEKLLCYERVLSLDPENAFAAAGRDFLSELVAAVRPEPAAVAETVEEAVILEEAEDHSEQDMLEMAEPAEEMAEVAEIPEVAEPIASEAATGMEIFESAAPPAYESAIEIPTDIPLEDPEPLSSALKTRLDPPYFPPEEEIVKEPAASREEELEPQVDPMIMAAVLAELEANEAQDVLDPIGSVESDFDGELHVSSESYDEAPAIPAPEAETLESPFTEFAEEENPAEQPPSDYFDDGDKILESTVLDYPQESPEPAANEADDFVKAYDSRFSDQPEEPALDHVEEEDVAAALHETEAAPLLASEPSYECPFCAADLPSQGYSCSDCRAILSLDDVESILASSTGDLERIHDSVLEMEASWNTREFTSRELADLGIGHLNLKNFDRGLRYLQEAARLDPDNLILVSQVNSLAIRLDEMRRHEESTEFKPKGCSILVVDDSATVRKLISNKLEKHGHTVICAADGVEAMEAIDNFTPELVLLDISMPRMDGYQVCKMIRSHETAKDVPVVMISGKDGFFDKVRGRMSGCTGYITKPFGPETLMKALDTYLTQPSQPVVE